MFKSIFLAIPLALAFMINPAAEAPVSDADICLKVRGIGKSLGKLRVGPNDHSGACCQGVSSSTTVTVCGKSGYNVYDSDTKRLLFTLSSSNEGRTIDLRNYY